LPTFAIAAFGGVLALAVSLGRPHGLFEAVGGLAGGAVLAILTALAFLTAKILLGPVTWFFQRIHLSLAPIRSLAQRLSHLTIRPDAGQQHPFGLGWFARLLGLLVLTAAALVLVRMIHRRWPRAVPRKRAASDGSQSLAVEPPDGRGLRARRSRPHREMPADTVRRWYAEALLALERRGLTKPPAATPAEFLNDVERAIPGCRTQFMALTRAYEDVRYGSLGVERSVMQGLEEGRTTLMETLRRMSRADIPEEPAVSP
jgi:hypothetical protein